MKERADAQGIEGQGKLHLVLRALAEIDDVQKQIEEEDGTLLKANRSTEIINRLRIHPAINRFLRETNTKIALVDKGLMERERVSLFVSAHGYSMTWGEKTPEGINPHSVELETIEMNELSSLYSGSYFARGGAKAQKSLVKKLARLQPEAIFGKFRHALYNS